MKLDDFLKCKKVRLLTDGYTNLNKGSEYNLVRLEVVISNNAGIEGRYPLDSFEPVLDQAENPLQNIELTPEFEVVEPKFKVGDRVYYRAYADICVVSDVSDLGEVQIKGWREDYYNSRYFCHATQENYEMLCNLYPHIEFEQPPKELKGSDLCRAMLEKGWKFIPCYVSDDSDQNAIDHEYVDLIACKDHLFRNSINGYGHEYAVPFDSKTGEPLTQAVLDE